MLKVSTKPATESAVTNVENSSRLLAIPAMESAGQISLRLLYKQLRLLPLQSPAFSNGFSAFFTSVSGKRTASITWMIPFGACKSAPITLVVPFSTTPPSTSSTPTLLH